MRINVVTDPGTTFLFFDQMKKLLPTLALLLVVTATPAATITNKLSDIFGNAFSPSSQVRWIPQSTPLIQGDTTVLDVPGSTRITNGYFSATLVGGIYMADFGFPTKQIKVFVPPNDTNTYSFNQCAQFATNLYAALSLSLGGQMAGIASGLYTAGANVSLTTVGTNKVINADVSHSEVSNATNGLNTTLVSRVTAATNGIGSAAYHSENDFVASNGGFGTNNSILSTLGDNVAIDSFRRRLWDSTGQVKVDWDNGLLKSGLGAYGTVDWVHQWLADATVGNAVLSWDALNVYVRSNMLALGSVSVAGSLNANGGVAVNGNAAILPDGRAAFQSVQATNFIGNADGLTNSPNYIPIYSGTNWGSLSDFIQIGTVAAYLTNNGQIYLPQAPAGFGNYLMVKNTTNALDNFTMEIVYSLESNSGYALPIGEQSINPWWNKVLTTYYAPVDSHIHYVAGEVTPTDSVTHSAPPAGTDITLRLNVNGLTYIASVSWAGGVPFTYSYQDGGMPASGTALPSSGVFSIWNATTVGGAFLKSVKVYSSANKRPKYLFIGDSKTRGIGSGGRRFADMFPDSVVLAGQGDRTIEVVQDLPFILRCFSPQNVVLAIGRNDKPSGQNYTNNYPTIAGAFSCPVWHLSSMGEPALDQTTYDAYIRTTYPDHYIDVSSTNVCSDGVHPSPGKNNEVARLIRARMGLQPAAEQLTRYDTLMGSFNGTNVGLCVSGPTNVVGTTVVGQLAVTNGGTVYYLDLKK